ncbi:MAG TPA: DNA-formamidopyrimidine glycosylase family protein [Longimicrobiales bacterium]|nr:DNA-formamidopyrimidine glycosylase family protein [Longimicrobiales bacterium]
MQGPLHQHVALHRMPELPDVQVYIERLDALLRGRALERVRIANPFVLRSVDPPIAIVDGRRIAGFDRIGKRIVIQLEGDLFVVVHLMIAGRLRWREPGKKMGGRIVLAEFLFEHGTLYLTEAGTTRRAMLHVVQGSSGLHTFDRGGIDPMKADAKTFARVLRSENHTLKRSLTDPRLFSGIGNAYSDEILHRAQLSPLALSGRLTDEDVAGLHSAVRATLTEWTARLRSEAGDAIPEKVTAFHPGMAVHGRFGQPCPVCGAPVQRIRYAANETNYCARCQTGGRILADRAMSRLLKDDWPRSIDHIE